MPKRKAMSATITKTRVALFAMVLALSVPIEGRSEDMDDIWALLAAVKVREIIDGNEWRAEKTFPAELIARMEDFRITGYIVPVDAQPYLRNFLLVQDPADCPFCGSGGYGPVLEVNLKRPLSELPEFSRVTVRGPLTLIDDPETLQMFRMQGAMAIARP